MNPEIIRDPAEEYRALLQDPEIRKELAARDPEFAKRFEKEEIRRIVGVFRQRNPSYLADKAGHNASIIFSALAEKHLHQYGLDVDEAASELWRAGKFTLAEIEGQYQTCLAAGVLRVPRGTVKQLTEKQKLEVIASIRLEQPEVAVIRYLQHAFGGKIPYEFDHDVRQFMAAYPELCSEAAVFVWRNTHPDIDDAEFQEFHQAKLANAPLLTVELLENAFEAWQKSKWQSRALGAVDDFREQAAERTEDLDDLSDAELDRRLLQARKAARAQQ